MKKLDFTAEEVNSKLNLIDLINSTANTAVNTAETAKYTAETAQHTADTAQYAADTAAATAKVAKGTAEIAKRSVGVMEKSVDSIRILADATDVAFKGFIAGSELNLKGIQLSLQTNENTINATRDWAERQLEINKNQYEAAIKQQEAALEQHKAAVLEHAASKDELAAANFELEAVKTMANATDIGLKKVSLSLGDLSEITDEFGHIVGYQSEAIKDVLTTGLQQFKDSKAYTDSQIKITNSAMNTIESALGGIEKIGDATGEGFYYQAIGVQKIAESVDAVEKSIGAMQLVVNANTTGVDAAKNFQEAATLQLAAIEKAHEAVASDHELLKQDHELTKTTLTETGTILTNTKKLAENSATLIEAQAASIQNVKSAIEAEGTGLAALKIAADAAQDAANANKTAFEVFYKKDDSVDNPTTVFGIFKKVVDEHNAAMDNTETGLAALHTAIGAVRDITDSQATLISGQAGLIKDQRELLVSVQNIAKSSKEFLDTHKAVLENTITATDITNKINEKATEVLDTVAKNQQVIADKASEATTAANKATQAVAGIGDKVAEQMEIAFGTDEDPNTNANVKAIRKLARDASEQAKVANKAATDATTAAGNLKKTTDKITKETIPGINSEISGAKQDTAKLKEDVQTKYNDLERKYTQLNTNIENSKKEVAALTTALDGDGTEANPGILSNVSKAQQDIAQSISDIGQAQQNIAAINIDLAEKNEAISAAVGRLDDAEGVLNGLDERFATVDGKIVDAQNTISDLTMTTSELADKATGISNTVNDTILPNIKNAEGHVINITAKLGEIDKAFEENTKKFVQTNKDLAAAAENIKKAQDDIGTMQTNLDDAKTIITEAQTNVTNISKQLTGDKDKDPKDTGIVGQMQVLNQNISDANKSISDAKTSFDKSFEDYNTKLFGENGLKAQMDATALRITETETKLNDPETGIFAKIDTAQEQINVASQRIDANKTSLELSIKEFENKVLGDKDATDEKAKLGLLGQAEQKIDAADQKISDAGKKIAEADKKLSTATDILGVLGDLNTDAAENLKGLIDASATAKTTLAQLQDATKKLSDDQTKTADQLGVAQDQIKANKEEADKELAAAKKDLHGEDGNGGVVQAAKDAQTLADNAQTSANNADLHADNARENAVLGISGSNDIINALKRLDTYLGTEAGKYNYVPCARPRKHGDKNVYGYDPSDGCYHETISYNTVMEADYSAGEVVISDSSTPVCRLYLQGGTETYKAPDGSTKTRPIYVDLSKSLAMGSAKIITSNTQPKGTSDSKTAAEISESADGLYYWAKFTEVTNIPMKGYGGGYVSTDTTVLTSTYRPVVRFCVVEPGAGIIARLSALEVLLIEYQIIKPTQMAGFYASSGLNYKNIPALGFYRDTTAEFPIRTSEKAVASSAMALSSARTATTETKAVSILGFKQAVGAPLREVESKQWQAVMNGAIKPVDWVAPTSSKTK